MKRKAKRKDDGPLEIVSGFIVEHQIGTIKNLSTPVRQKLWLIIDTGLAVNLLMLLALTHMSFPRARRHTRKFFELSYFNPESGEYRAGWNDAWMVSFWIVAFTGLRAAVMDYILTPLAKKGGVKSQRDLTRFSEQAWLLTYYAVFWPLGVVRQTPLVVHFFAKESSTSMSILTTILTSRTSGRIGRIVRWRGCQSGTRSFNTLSGCSRSWSFTLRRDARTIGRCCLITSSRRC